MATIKYSPLVDSLSGPAGGASFGAWKNRAYVRTTPRRIADDSYAQFIRKLNYRGAWCAWIYTPAPMRYGWDALAAPDKISPWNACARVNAVPGGFPHYRTCVPQNKTLTKPGGWQASAGALPGEVDIQWDDPGLMPGVWCNVVVQRHKGVLWSRESTFVIPADDLAMTLTGLDSNCWYNCYGWFAKPDYSEFSVDVVDNVYVP